MATKCSRVAQPSVGSTHQKLLINQGDVSDRGMKASRRYEGLKAHAEICEPFFRIILVQNYLISIKKDSSCSGFMKGPERSLVKAKHAE